MRFKENVALIVGGASGMGKATALQMAKEGASVVAFDWQKDKLEALKAEAAGLSGTLEIYAGNVNDEGARKGAVSYMKEKYGKMDSFVYAAGLVDFMTAPHNCDDELWDALMDVTVNSAFKLTREALPLLWDHEGKASSVVYISSVGGFEHTSSGTAYVAAKHALTALGKNLALCCSYAATIPREKLKKHHRNYGLSEKTGDDISLLTNGETRKEKEDLWN